jgi:hypothetical protein
MTLFKANIMGERDQKYNKPLHAAPRGEFKGHYKVDCSRKRLGLDKNLRILKQIFVKYVDKDP